MFFGSKKFTTIDIGSYAVKVARFRVKKGSVLSIEAGINRLPEKTIVDGVIEDQSIVAAELDETFSKLNFKPKQPVITVSNNNLIIRTLELPLMSESELAETIKWEADDQLPYSVENARLDYNIVSQNEENMNVLITAINKEVVDNYLETFAKVGLNPAVLNVQPMALISLLEYRQQIPEPVAIIDIGASATHVTIGTAKNIFLARTINFGGNDFTESLVKSTELNYKKAEEEKIKTGLEGADNNSVNINPDSLDLESLDIEATNEFNNENELESIASNLASEISRSLDFFSIKNRGQNIEKVYITGGSSKLKGLRDIISEEIDQDLNPLNVFQGFDVKITGDNYCQNCEDEFAVAVGLGVSEVLADEG